MGRRKKKWERIQRILENNGEVAVEPVVEEAVEQPSVEEVVAEEIPAVEEEANSVVENVEEMLEEAKPVKKSRNRKKKVENEDN